MSYPAKYAPKRMSEVVFSSPYSQTQANMWTQNQSTTPILLFGPNGSGKSSLARTIIHEVYGPIQSGDVLMISATRARKFEKIASSLANFCPVTPWSANAERRFVLIDEFDLLSTSAQANFKSLLDQYSDKCHFIMTTNELGKVEKGVRSRSLCVDMPAIDPNAWLPRLRHILKQEKEPVPPDHKLLNIGQMADGDGREILKLLEEYVYNRRKNATPPTAPLAKPKLKVLSKVSK